MAHIAFSLEILLVLFFLHVFSSSLNKNMYLLFISVFKTI